MDIRRIVYNTCMHNKSLISITDMRKNILATCDPNGIDEALFFSICKSIEENIQERVLIFPTSLLRTRKGNSKYIDSR